MLTPDDFKQVGRAASGAADQLAVVGARQDAAHKHLAGYIGQCGVVDSGGGALTLKP
jgi:hypothetical protein